MESRCANSLCGLRVFASLRFRKHHVMISIDSILEANVVPDPLIRLGIRHLLAETLREKTCANVELQRAALLAHIAGLKQSAIAVQTRDANEQHYEVPTRFTSSASGVG